MTKKTFIILLVLSVMVTYAASIFDALVRNSFIAGEAGFPFRFSSSSLFGAEDTNMFMLFLDILFWFIVLYLVKFLLQKVIQKH